jgi:hypothetical protein
VKEFVIFIVFILFHCFKKHINFYHFVINNFVVKVQNHSWDLLIKIAELVDFYYPIIIHKLINFVQKFYEHKLINIIIKFYEQRAIFYFTLCLKVLRISKKTYDSNSFWGKFSIYWFKFENFMIKLHNKIPILFILEKIPVDKLFFLAYDFVTGLWEWELNQLYRIDDYVGRHAKAALEKVIEEQRRKEEDEMNPNKQKQKKDTFFSKIPKWGNLDKGDKIMIVVILIIVIILWEVYYFFSLKFWR